MIGSKRTEDTETANIGIFDIDQCSFLQNVNMLMAEKNISKADLARQSKIPYTTIDGWYKKSFNGVRLDTMLKLARYFDVSLDFLATGKNVSFSLTESRIIDRYRKLDNHGKRVVNAVMDEEIQRLESEVYAKPEYRKLPERKIPLYTALAAAGLAAPVEGDDYEMISVDDNVPARAQFAIKISGDSMQPMIDDGETVYCVKDGVSLTDGDIGVFCVNGAYYCKQYRTDGENIYLVSANRKRSNSDITIWANSDSSVIFLGKVLI